VEAEFCHLQVFRWRCCAVVVGFGLGRGNVSDGFEEAPVVVPVDPFHCGQLDGVETALGPLIRPMRQRGDRVWGRGHRQRFWDEIARGATSEDAGVMAGVSLGCGVLRRGQARLGSPLRMSLSPVSSSARDWGTREWGMSIRGSRV